MEAHKGKWMIQKGVFGTKGLGIKLLNDFSEVNVSKSSVVQEYIMEPALFNGYKVDLRVYILITSLDPLIAYVHEAGYAKLASQLY